MPIIDLYIDYNIETAPEDHKHYRDGWVNIECPHCTGTEGYHLGFNSYGNYYSCYRCGPHQVAGTLMKLLQLTYPAANKLTEDYRLDKKGKGGKREKQVIDKDPFEYPSGIVSMQKHHKRYLEKRGFDPDYIEKEFEVVGTSPTSILESGDKIIPYKYRILYPIYWEEKVVSFQTRDYTNKQKLKYLTCPEKREIIHHKHILYGSPSMRVGGKGICVEGALDVWKLGRSAFATLGTGYTMKQLLLIAKLYDEIFIVFDPESIARIQAVKMKARLKAVGIKVHNYTELTSDPGDLSQDDANHLLKEFGLGSGRSSGF